MLNVLRRSVARRKAAERLALAIAERARAPVFYRDLAVPDTFNGRFDMVALHGWLVLERLEMEGARAVSQGVVNTLFYRFEDALRDQGAGDMGMTRRVKAIAGAFYGRLSAYRRAAEENALAAALLRNVYGENPAAAGAADRLAAYVLAARARLAHGALSQGDIDFGTIGTEQGRACDDP